MEFTVQLLIVNMQFVEDVPSPMQNIVAFDTRLFCICVHNYLLIFLFLIYFSLFSCENRTTPFPGRMS